ncbi:dTMP kinase [Wohlfahrtiimonas chitiniclastica]|uniref:dTMP kinase n=1 Tax=Wohlfahrtiimonas chitiniclastica TaxID=400946 RepID=UPI001BCE78CA|nr:dTMP kinase [Wohlfahrtiimonas chitiniclastica]MBS7815511.1 dTMP kinase [Wohlfahrtiimonas chitiniclastica]
MQTGRFITFEGTEGAGKSTQIPLLKAWLESQGKTVITTREPGGTPLSEKIRALLLNDDMTAETELLLMFAARKEHIEQVIQPALLRGDWVLCDRFTEATYAYQAAGRAIDVSRIAYLEDWLQGTLRPDCTLWFDIDVAEGMARAEKRHALDRFEQEAMSFFDKVRSGYAEQATKRPEQFKRIDAALSIDEITLQITEQLQPLL